MLREGITFGAVEIEKMLDVGTHDELERARKIADNSI
jgi:hypothetical protein